MKEIRYGIVGFGHQGEFYAGILDKNGKDFGAKLVSICDIDNNKRKDAETKFSYAKIYEKYEDLINPNEIDVVLIETPHYFHPQIAIYAFNHGVNVLSDKPIGVYCKDVIEEIRESEKHPELLFGMFFNQRTNPLYIKAKEIITSEDFGKMTRLNWIITDWYRTQAYYDQGGWRGTFKDEGGGVLLNQCPHQIDLLVYFAGLPNKVTSTVRTVGRNISVENDVTAILEYDDMTATFITSTHDTPGTNRLEFTGTGGKVVIENDVLTFYKNKIKENVFSIENKEFMSKPEFEVITYSLNDDESEETRKTRINFGNAQPQHMLILKRYTEVMLGKEKELYAYGIDGLNELTLSNAIHLSGWLGKTVSIPLDNDLFLEMLKKKISEEKK
ncbi:MAG: Gfo/Idh/MocA family oxidoreductase [Bacilli bacterium]|nr:Gfo/Idh/MocA family oxidoreductase [Bacilli bacterium]